MIKQLLPATIIPDHLYVERSADRQIKDVVEQAGRPGYVLVSRQMGKTNLLLHAKETIATSNDAFVYVDLSNKFDTTRDCFRNIIDSATDIYSSKFGHLIEKIQSNRLASTVPPHKEHEAELRTLLSALSGKLVIILDEVDSLRATNYSDDIFAQVRSAYFSRTNYPEFKRLTYVLSGVAEPKELIRNKDISPFNIGQKIYLSDFSYDEVKEFVGKARLNLPDHVLDRVYFWTKGNPRITWDLCSEIEDRLIDGDEVDTDTVDDIINSLYLTNFDLAPVDHVRTLVENDSELQSAIIQIRFNKGRQLSSALKNKLFLAGIIGPFEKSDEIAIRNPVIEQSLPDEWLQSIAARDANWLHIAEQKFEDKDFVGAASNYRRYIAQTHPNDPTIPTVQFALGKSLLMSGDYPNALNELKLVKFDRKANTGSYLQVHYNLGLVNAYLENNEEAEKHFREVIAGDLKDQVYYLASVNLAYTLFDESDPVSVENALSIANQVISDLESLPDRNSDERSSLVSAYYLKLRISRARKDVVLARGSFQSAMKIANSEQAFILNLEMARVALPSHEGLSALKNSVELLAQQTIPPTQHKEALRFSSTDLIRLAVLTYDYDPAGLYLNLIQQVNSRGNSELGNFLLDLIGSANEQNLMETVAPMVSQALSLHGKIFEDQPELQLQLYYVSTLSTDGLMKHFNKFWKLQLASGNSPSPIHLSFFSMRLNILIQQKSFHEASMMLRSLDKIDGDKESELNQYLSLIKASWPMVLNGLGDKQQALLVADTAYKNLQSLLPTYKENRFLPKINITKRIEDLRASGLVQTIKPTRVQDIGRNDKVKVRFKDGSIREDKFKRLKDDVNAGRCSIIEVSK